MKALKPLLRLMRTPDGREIRFIRASTLGHYYYCAVQAWLMAQGLEPPRKEALSEGRRIHDEIAKARKLSKWEKEFQDYITQFMVPHPAAGEGSTGLKTEENMVFLRKWYDGNTVIGYITTHGVDDFRVYPDRTVILVEYKTTKQNVIDYYKLAPAVFQLKVYMWILEPYLNVGGYKIQRGEIVFLKRLGKGRIKPLGIKQIVDYDAADVERQISQILYQFNHPEELIPCAKWKCKICPEVFKKRCPFQ